MKPRSVGLDNGEFSPTRINTPFTLEGYRTTDLGWEKC
ncbi:hypothetical protein BMETH_277_5 [methanotrophic bacterial endosymbiont of Bathymodiolus sp.]|nr:hypothetical protein BMETH_277_5 [methanotrophic bacterial endosymbiont of Bathymodiolus sp.]